MRRALTTALLASAKFGSDAATVTYFGTGGGSTYTTNRCVDGEPQLVRVNRKTFLATIEQYEADRSFLVNNYDPVKDRGDFTAISVINPDFTEDYGQNITCPS